MKREILYACGHSFYHISPKETAALLKNLKEERSTFYRSYLISMSSDNPFKAADEAVENKLPDSAKNHSTFSYIIGQCLKTDEKKTLKWLDKLTSKEREAAMPEISQHFITTDLVKGLNWVAERTSVKEQMTLMDKLVTSWALSQPYLTVSRGMPKGKKVPCLIPAIKIWHAQEPKKFKAWLSGLSTKALRDIFLRHYSYRFNEELYKKNKAKVYASNKKTLVLSFEKNLDKAPLVKKKIQSTVIAASAEEIHKALKSYSLPAIKKYRLKRVLITAKITGIRTYSKKPTFLIGTTVPGKSGFIKNPVLPWNKVKYIDLILDGNKSILRIKKENIDKAQYAAIQKAVLKQLQDSRNGQLNLGSLKAWLSVSRL